MCEYNADLQVNCVGIEVAICCHTLHETRWNWLYQFVAYIMSWRLIAMLFNVGRLILSSYMHIGIN